MASAPLERRPGDAAGAITEIDVLWMTAGLSCDGDTIAMTAATQPSLEDLVLGGMPWIPRVHVRNPFLAYEVGDDFLAYFHRAAEGTLDPFILVVEGSIPDEANHHNGSWASFGTDQETGQPIPTCGLLSALGHNPTIAIHELAGDLYCAPGDLRDASVSIRIDATRFTVQDNISDKDRREIERVTKEEVLETDRFPEITFDSTHVSVSAGAIGPPTVQVTGRLSLHGTTRDFTLAAQLAPIGDVLRAFGSFSLRQTDFGIKLVSVAAGGLKVKDEVNGSFDIVARQRG